MSSTPHETVILTTAFYGILLLSLLTFSTVYRWVLIDSARIRLGEISNQVAYELASIYSMCQQSENEVQLFKPIRIPVSISEVGYAIELKKIGNVWFVVAYLEENRAINASSPIWEDPGDTVYIGPAHDYETFTISRGHGSYTVNCSFILHSGKSIPVIWAKKSVTPPEVRVGVGWIEKSGGGD